MHATLPLLALCLQGLTAIIAQPLDDCSLGPRDANGDLDLVGDAINLEQYIDEETGQPEVRFKENMGPGSDWYNEFVAPYDEYIDEEYAGYANVTAPDTSFARRDSGHVSKINRSHQRLIWGNTQPYDLMLNGIMNNCKANTCDLISWSHNIDFVADNTRHGGTLHFTGSGKWPNNKKYYAQAIAHIAKKLHRSGSKTYAVCTPASPTHPGTCSSHQMTQAATGKYFAILRFVKTPNGLAGSGNLTVKVTMTVDGDDACKYIIGGLSALMSSQGAVGALGGNYFGGLEKAICSS